MQREREREREGEGGGCRERVYIYMYGMVIVYLTQYISIHISIRIYCVTNIKYVWILHYKNTEDNTSVFSQKVITRHNCVLSKQPIKSLN